MSNKVITTWRPDTCGCELSYSWERGSSEDDRVHTPETFKPCEAHKQHDLHHGHTVVIEENQRKNKVVNSLGETTGVKASEFYFAFNEDRTLLISHAILDAHTIQIAQAGFDQVHGKGTVKLSNG